MRPPALHDLMRRFATLPGASLGADLDPARVGTPWADAAAGLIAAHPELARDPGYGLFLGHYGGAALEDPDSFGPGFRQVVIFGFGEYDADGPHVSADGYHGFASAQVRYRPRREAAPFDDGVAEVSFGFDATGARPPGVYWLASTIDGPPAATPARLQAGSFLAWLDQFIRADGRLLPPEVAEFP